MQSGHSSVSSAHSETGNGLRWPRPRVMAGALIDLGRRGFGRVHQAPSLPSFAAGVLIGVLAASTAISWLVALGDQRELNGAAVLLGTIGLILGGRMMRGRTVGLGLLAGVACLAALLQPMLSQGLTAVLAAVPVVWLESTGVKGLVAVIMAGVVWWGAGTVWGCLAVAAARQSLVRGSSSARANAAQCLGVACGLALNAFVAAPWCGVWLVNIISLIVVGGCWWLGRQHRLFAQDSSVHTTSVSDNDQSCSDNDQSCSRSIVAAALAAVALGGLFATAARLLGQLMLGAFPFASAGWIGLIAGCGCGWLWCQRVRLLAVGSSWWCLAAAAWSALLLAVFPVVVDASLWMNSSLTWVTLLMTARVLMLMVAVMPLGAALAGLLQSHLRVSQPWSGPGTLVLAFAVGWVASGVALETTGLVTPLTVCCGTLVVLALVERVRSMTGIPDWRGWSGAVCLALMGLSVPLWRSQDDPARVAKLLFSTPAFVAHRSGWESPLLTQLDDTRLVFRSEGPRGPLTLWRSRGLELHLRDNGVPRAVISANTDVYPQFAPEVLQAALPLVIADKPGRVLILGASGGVPLSTCLRLPVREAVCVEGDARLIELLRGPLARETGFDPLADDRVKLVAVAPELALMARDDQFDVILSSPPPSSIVAGAASFTTEYYQRASRRLAERGVFCQRFECLDYGPDPLRIVVQSLRQAFREVIAVETAAGELLLMGTNSEGVFVPDDLPARLEAPHVRRLLAQSGLDWSTPLNFPAYDHAALGEICSETRTWSNSPANGLLALRAPLDVMRWGTKLQDVQQMLTATRLTPAPFWNRNHGQTPNLLQSEAKLSRKSRFLDWLGDSLVSADLLRRLSEVASQQKLVRENPETHWWEYRKALRQQLQDHPRSNVQQVTHVRGQKQTHPEDLLRKTYFEALGDAAGRAAPTSDQIAAIEACLEPYDPLLSYFARQEIADLQARGRVSPTGELAHRLHVIYFAPGTDASTRNVATALELLVSHPETISDPARRFDVLNGLVQTLRTRWEVRQNVPVKSVRRQLTDVDRNVVAIERAIAAMDELAREAGVSDDDWATRRRVLDRILLLPLRSYHAQLKTTATKNEGQARAVIDEAAKSKDRLTEDDL